MTEPSDIPYRCQVVAGLRQPPPQHPGGNQESDSIEEEDAEAHPADGA